MAELLGHDLHRDAGLQREAGGGVAEVVQPDGWQARQAGQPLEAVGGEIGMEQGAVLPGEHQAGGIGGEAPGVALACLDVAPAAEDRRSAFVDRDGSGSAVGLRLADLGLPPELDDLLGHADLLGVEVNVLPAEAYGLSSAEAAVCDQMEQRVEPVVRCGVEEAAHLVGCPHRDGGLLRPVLPGGDAVRGPHDGAGSPTAGDLDVLRWVGRDVPPSYRGVQ